MMLQNGFRRIAALVAAASLAVFLLPGLTAAHSELVSSDPALGSIVSSPFSGPIVLTFSEHLATGSKADLVAPDGTTIAAATVDGNAMTMSFALTGPLPAGAYKVQWVSIADDTDLLRGILTFTVSSAASDSPPASIAPTASAAPTTTADSPSPSIGPTPVPSAAGDSSGSGSDVVLPIIVALIVLGAGAAYLLTRRNRPAAPS
jgi:methionine-rich copper-binding protein CopC